MGQKRNYPVSRSAKVRINSEPNARGRSAIYLYIYIYIFVSRAYGQRGRDKTAAFFAIRMSYDMSISKSFS